MSKIEFAPIPLAVHLERAARTIGGGDEPERAASFRILLDAYRGLLRSRKRDGKRIIGRAGLDMDSLCLMNFFEGINAAVCESDDPAAAWRALMGKNRRGPKPKNEDRDFEIAVSVQRHVEQGKSLRKAYAEIAKVEELSWFRVKTIYQKFEPKELKLEAGFIEEHAQAVEEAESKRTI